MSTGLNRRSTSALNGFELEFVHQVIAPIIGGVLAALAYPLLGATT